MTIEIHNCSIVNWYDYCVYYFTDAQGQGPDGWRISNSNIGQCAGTGFYVTGHNSQVGTMMNSFVTRCASGRAIHDASFLGNTYIAVMCSYGGILTTGDSPNAGNSCTFIGCYVESGNPCNIAYPSVVIGGELSVLASQEVPLGSAFFCDGTNISNGLIYFASESTGAYFDGKHTWSRTRRGEKRPPSSHSEVPRDPHTLMSFGEVGDPIPGPFPGGGRGS